MTTNRHSDEQPEVKVPACPFCGGDTIQLFAMDVDDPGHPLFGKNLWKVKCEGIEENDDEGIVVRYCTGNVTGSTIENALGFWSRRITPAPQVPVDALYYEYWDSDQKRELQEYAAKQAAEDQTV